MKNVLPVTLAILLIFAVGYGAWQTAQESDQSLSPQACVAFTPTLAFTATSTIDPVYCVPLGTSTAVFLFRPTSTGIKGDTTQVFTTLSYTSTTHPTDTQISNPTNQPTSIPPTARPTNPPHPTDQPQPTDKPKCNQGIGNGSEGCDPGNSNNNQDSNDEPGKRGN